MSQPRYEPEYKEMAKKETEALYTIDIDRRHYGETRSTTWGVCPKKLYPYLKMAKRVMDEIDPAVALADMYKELAAL